ncbi:MAG: putative phage portal protein [Anaerosolibacter sp.]|jgi:HK97 family phage portal protein|uniref:phage portal protein n=1 Tax=Anaerosolibacter sp. TaxID=1872527 RepID=UPI0026142D28|nr:phage portal protein [Anaerosolibacter sp.]MDF2546137.1 putative phage portal protein [Anaerosolibacter sp.]
MVITQLFKNIFSGRKSMRKYISMLNDDTAMFSAYGEDVYMSDFVNNCIDRIATEISKINIISVVESSEDVKKQNDDITRLFRFRPNKLQTTKDFLACCEWLRRKDHNCFIYPQYINVQGRDSKVYKKYIAFYPLNPTSIEIGTDGNEVWEIKFYFQDGSSYILPYDEIIHLRWRRGKNTIIGGGDDLGQPDTRELLRSIKVLDQVMQGLPKSIEASLKIKGLYSAKTVVDGDKLRAARDSFEQHLFSSKAGIVATDLGGEFTPMNINPAKIEEGTLKFLKSILRERYGISDVIIGGDYTGEQHSAFYQNCIEDFIIEFEQAVSSTVFSQREQDIGHRVKCYYDRVAYLSTQNKIDIASIATNVGNMTLNQINEMFGVPPFEGGNRRLQSLNYTNVELVDKYQLGKVGVNSEPSQLK